MEEHLQKVGAGPSPMTAEISQELAARMAACLRDAVKAADGDMTVRSTLREARAIVALLPAPIDPDKAIMREIVDRHLAACSYGTDAMFMELLNRGRELAASK